MNLPSNLAHGGSLETVPQRCNCMAPSGVVKVAVTAGALSKETIEKHSTGIVLRACHVLYYNISKCADVNLYPH